MPLTEPLAPMTASPVQTPAARKAASQKATLDALAGSVSAFVQRELGDMAARMAAALADVGETGLDTREVYRRVKSARLLRENGYAFVHLASKAIDLAVRRELDELGPGKAQAAPVAALSLVPLEEIDDKLAFSALARPFDIQHSEALATLGVRLGLLLERGLLRAGDNPFRPAVFLKALDAAWREFEPDSEAHGLVQGLLRPDIVFDFAPLFEALTEAVKRKDGRADAVHFQKTDDAAAARAARAGSRAALAKQLRALFGDDGGDAGVPLIPELPVLPAGKGGWRPSGAAGFQGPQAFEAGQGGAADAGTVSAQAPVRAAAGFAGVAAGIAPSPAADLSGVPEAAAGQAAGFAAMQGAAPAQAAGFAAMPGTPFVAGASAVQPAAGFAALTGMPASGLLAPGDGMGVAPAGGVAMAGFAGTAGAGATPAAHWAGIPVLGLVAAATGAAAPGPAMAPAAASAPLLDLLARIEPILADAAPATAPAAGLAEKGAAVPHNVFYLPRLKQSLPQGSLSRGDANTLDLLSRVFETVLLDDGMPAKARELLQVLQVPVLKAALRDKQFFFEETHPARRLVDLLSRMGWEQHKDADDPLFQAMRRSVEQVAGTGGFQEAVAGLEASIEQEDSAREQALAAPVAGALKQEKMAVATQSARDAVALRVGAGDVNDVVSGFLEQRWSTVLTFAYSIEIEKPGAVGNATRAMDDLIWSVKPKATQEQRKALIARLPRLLATLNKWLDAIRWQDAERLQFFARLAEYHASIVRAPIELSPERQLELAVEAAQSDAMRRVELENAAAEQAAARQEALSPVDGLERGMWCEFRSSEGKRKVRLAWVSPLRTLFIFSGAGRREAFSMTAEKLADALHSGAARVLAMEGVVGQVLLAAMARPAENDSGNDASIQARALP